VRRILKPISKIWLKLSGFEVLNSDPSLRKCVIVAAPHTSNWDMPHTMAVGTELGLEFNWLGKDTLFKRPWGGFMKWLGGVPIDRRKSGNYVDTLVREFQERENLILVMAVEGTRSRTDHWRSGFYHIAKAADVPIVPGYLDYKAKRGGLGTPIYPIGTPEEVMEQLREFYRDIEGHFPDKFGPVKLASED